MSEVEKKSSTVRALLLEAARILPTPEARLEAEILLVFVLDVSRTWLFAHADDDIDAGHAERYRGLLAARAAGQPIAYLTGNREFWSLPLQVTPDTLIPRADTELLVEQALLHIPQSNIVDILDLGTGSGAIALALAHERPQARVVATDLSRAALAVACGNAQQLGIGNIRFCEGSWFGAIKPQCFDVIVSNPPYIRANDHHLGEGDLRFEPLGALASGVDGLDAIREIICGAHVYVKPDSWLLFEHGLDQAADIRTLLLKSGFVDVYTSCDLEQRDRVTGGRWVKAAARNQGIELVPSMIMEKIRAQSMHLGIAVLALLFVFFTFTPSYITGTGPAWLHLSGDVAQGQIGWWYFAHDAWHFPLFDVRNYNLPEGSNLLLSDSLPLFALPAKLLYQATGWLPIYIGLWGALCFLLQVVFASRLLRTLEVMTPLAHFSGVVLLCYTPVLFIRIGQNTLLAQFILLAAIEIYVRTKRDGLTLRGWIIFGAWPLLALLVHPYLALMAGLMFGISLIDQCRMRRLSTMQATQYFATLLIAGLSLSYCGGFFFAGKNYGDYGLYSLNLLAPFVPFAETTLGGWLGTRSPTIPDIHQWDGGCYLGAGILLLLLLALSAWRSAISSLHRHATLAIMFALLLLFAISNRIGFGEHELLHIPLPESLIAVLSTFRGSGRFAWLPLYACAAFLIVLILRRFGSSAGSLILCIAALLQLADVAPMQASRRAGTAVANTPNIHVDAWQGLIAAHRDIFQYPSFECGALYGRGIPGTHFSELEIEWIAAQLNRPTNSAYLARPHKGCAQEKIEAISNHAVPGRLYLYRSAEDIGTYLAANGVKMDRCGLLDDVVVCSADQDLSRLRPY